ncbi:ATP-binding protein [Streptomyces sp. NRRL S-813]|uniref:ATP-binding protein n=1 Tax=Streptomyces sp. NRRL S-813 TaxID=1463919 RepID=UPI0004C0B80F|nr:ATP-binding protein [Streptomyces sp. NRRL S-813]
MAARLRNGSPSTIITVACPPGLTATVCEDRLDRAVTDLICNAQQHGHGPIEVTAEPDDGQIRVQVRDRGPGFPPGSRGNPDEALIKDPASDRVTRRLVMGGS